MPAYTTFRTGAGHLPVFTCTVELAGVVFTGEPAKNKKQAEKNAAMAAWLSLKSLVQQSESSSSEKTHKDEQEHVIVARALQKYIIKARLARMSFPIKFPTLNPRPSSTQHSPSTTSKILPMICPATASRNRPILQKVVKTTHNPQANIIPNESHSSSSLENYKIPPLKFPAAGAEPYIPIRHCYPNHRVAPPVTIRNSIPVFSAPSFPSPQSSVVIRPQTLNTAPPVNMRQAVPVFAAPHPAVKVEDQRIVRPLMSRPLESHARPASNRLDESLLSKISSIRAEEPIGSKFLPVSLVPKFQAPSTEAEPPQSQMLNAQVESLISKANDAVASPEAAEKESIRAEKDEMKELTEIEGLKDLKI